MKDRATRRKLGLGDLVLYGLVLVQPTAPVPLYGVAQKLSLGHTTTVLLAAMVAMLFTARSYGRMATLYPDAGSAYVYVGRGLHPALGFAAGWAMSLDLLLIPITTTIFAALTLVRLVPFVPYAVWVAVLVIAITAFNLRGIAATARANLVLFVVMGVIIAIFAIAAVLFVIRRDGMGGLASIRPLYHPATFKWAALLRGTAFIALTFIGFDGVTTLAEDAQDAHRTMAPAVLLVCLLTGVGGAVQVYLAQLSEPISQTFADIPNVETAFLDVAARVGGHVLMVALAGSLLVACVGTILTSQGSAARLLLGMGRDDRLPRRIFGVVSAGTGVPVANVIIVGLVTGAGALTIGYETAAELVNFGAFTAFLGVNAAAAREAMASKSSWNLASALMGFLFCAAIWWGLPSPSKIVGAGWLIVGIAFVFARGRRGSFPSSVLP